MMREILLDGYQPLKNRWPVYTLDTELKEVKTLLFADYRERQAFGQKCGYGDFRYFGKRFARVKGFFALYAQDSSLYLWLNGQSYDLIRDDVSVRWGIALLSQKHFCVYVDAMLAFDCRYSNYDDHWDNRDIFWWMSDSLKSMENRFRILLSWQDRMKGTNPVTDKYWKDLDTNERVKMALATDKYHENLNERVKAAMRDFASGGSRYR